ncbi:MAG: chemotaxis protein CheW, partial [Acidobacteriota bacterium]
EETEYTQRTCIIVTEVWGENGAMMIGAVVDGVSEVLNLGPGDSEAPPDFGGAVAAAGLLGMAKVKGRVKILLDIDHVMTHQDLDELGNLFG